MFRFSAVLLEIAFVFPTVLLFFLGSSIGLIKRCVIHFVAFLGRDLGCARSETLFSTLF